MEHIASKDDVAIVRSAPAAGSPCAKVNPIVIGDRWASAVSTSFYTHLGFMLTGHCSFQDMGGAQDPLGGGGTGVNSVSGLDVSAGCCCRALRHLHNGPKQSAVQMDREMDGVYSEKTTQEWETSLSTEEYYNFRTFEGMA